MVGHMYTQRRTLAKERIAELGTEETYEITGKYNNIRTFDFLAELEVPAEAHNCVDQSAQAEGDDHCLQEVARRALLELSVVLRRVVVCRESEILHVQARSKL